MAQTLMVPLLNLPSWTWSVDPTLQTWSSRLAFVLLIIWLGALLAKFAIPSQRAAGMGRGGAVRFIGAAIAIVILLDLSLIPKIINNALKIINYLGTMAGIY